MDQSVKAATAFLIEKTGKNPTLVETRGNGIFFQIEELNRSALNVFGDDLEYPQEQSYCLLEHYF